jgi:hypothetical protein
MTELSKSKKEWKGETGLINQEMLSRHLTNLQGGHPLWHYYFLMALVIREHP